MSPRALALARVLASPAVGERLRRYYLNVGFEGSLRMLLAHALVTALLLFLIITPEIRWYVPAIPAVVWILPYFARGALTRDPRRTRRIHNAALYGLMIVGALFRGPVKALGELGVVLVFSALTALLGVHWWLLSDPDIRADRL